MFIKAFSHKKFIFLIYSSVDLSSKCSWVESAKFQNIIPFVDIFDRTKNSKLILKNLQPVCS